MTAGLALTAFTIHKNTYRHPRDPMATQVYQQRDMEKNAEHSAAAPAAGEHAATDAAKPAEATPSH